MLQGKRGVTVQITESNKSIYSSKITALWRGSRGKKCCIIYYWC